MQRRDVDVGHVHRHLRDAVFVDVPSDGLGALQRSGLHDGVSVLVFLGFTGDGMALAHGTPFLTHVEGDGIGAARGSGVQVVVHGDEEVARTDGRTARALPAFLRSLARRHEVGLLAGCFQPLGQTLILSLTADSKVLPLGGEGGSLVAIAGDACLLGHSLG